MKYINKILLIFGITIIGIITFYNFMTYDRHYEMSKFFSEKINDNILPKIDFEYIKSEQIKVDEIKLSSVKNIKIIIQKALSKIDLMTYKFEEGEKLLLKSKNNSEQNLICKGYFMNDNIYSIEIESKNIDAVKLNKIKNIFDKEFKNYKIVWTEIN